MRYQQIIALEIGSDYARAVHAAHGWAGLTFTSAKSIKLPSDPEDRRRLLELFVQKNDWDGLPCVLGLSEDTCMIRALRRRPEAGRSTGEWVENEMRELTALSGEQTLSAYVDQGVVFDRRRVLVAAGRMDAIQRGIQLATGAGLRVTEAVPASMAHVGGIYYFLPKSTMCWANVYIDHAGTRVTICRREHVLFSRHFSIGWQAISQAAGQTHAQERWTRELRETFSQAGPSLKNGRVQRVVVSGETLYAEEARQYAAEALDLETVAADKFKKAQRFPYSIVYTTCVGLARQAAAPTRRRLSLQPPVLRQTAALNQQWVFWLGLGAAALFALLLLGVHLADRLRRTLEDKEYVLQAVEEARGLRAEAAELERRIEILNTQSQPFVTAAHNIRMMRLVLVALGDVKDERDWITYIGDRRSYFSSNADAADRDLMAFERMVVEGYTPLDDFSTVREMIYALEQQPGIMRVDLLGDDQIRVDPKREPYGDDIKARLFALELTLAQP